MYRCTTTSSSATADGAPRGHQPHGDVCQYLTAWFRCKAIGGHAVVSNEESSAVGRHSPAELPDLDAVDRLRVDTALDDGAPTWFAVPARTYDWFPTRS
jgi:8-oxo-dGTP diphosphatase